MICSLCHESGASKKIRVPDCIWTRDLQDAGQALQQLTYRGPLGELSQLLCLQDGLWAMTERLDTTVTYMYYL